jgi:hypothetical protein
MLILEDPCGKIVGPVKYGMPKNNLPGSTSLQGAVESKDPDLVSYREHRRTPLLRLYEKASSAG